MSNDWLLSKSKYDKKLIKQQKPFKDIVSKHKRVKSDVNTIVQKMFPETLESTQVATTNVNSKKFLKTNHKNNTVYSYTNKHPATAFTTRINKQDTKKGTAKKSAESSPLTMQNQPSVVTESSGRPPTVLKKTKTAGHAKNSMSTHLKKNENYFYSKEDDYQDDLDEFPTDIAQEISKKRNTTVQKEIADDDSSLFKYQEYKKMYFEDAKLKKNKQIIESNYATEQNKYTKLLNTHFNKGTPLVDITGVNWWSDQPLVSELNLTACIVTTKQGLSKKKNKSDYFNDCPQKMDNRNAIKFDVISSEPKSNASKSSTIKHSRKSSSQQKELNIIDKIVNKHVGGITKKQLPKEEEKKLTSKLYQYSDPKMQNGRQDDSSVLKSNSVVSFEYHRQESGPKFYKGETSNRNESYEIMELNSFNEIKNSDEWEEDRYDDAGLYGVFDRVLEEQKKFYESSSQRNNGLKDLADSMEERVDTLGSNVSETQMSPRSRQIFKVVKRIKEHFMTSDEPPVTTKEYYRIGKCIGKGAFGKVNLAIQKATQSLVAIKSINKQYLKDEGSKRKVMQEVYILKKIRHWNVVHFFETFETEKYILLVMELCGGGDLLNYVRKRRRLKEDLAKYFFKQIIEALHYIHQKNIVHRDIKLDNILLDHEGNVKICDFGVSKLVRPGELMTEQCGTPAYIAPEILLDKGYKGYGVDVWSAGVVLYSMLYGTVPFKGNSMNELHKLIIRGNVTFKDDISEEARDLLKRLLEWDPNLRLSTDQILRHEWLKDVKDNINIFTETEKEIIRTEFTYNDTRRLNRNMKNESTVFTEHNLDSTRNSVILNQDTKSVILAPFNSTKTHLSELHDSVKEIMFRKGEVFKLHARVRDIDRQYEFNNNWELDNGVYNRFVNEEEDKKDEEDKEEEKSVRLNDNEVIDTATGLVKKTENKNTVLRELEGMIEEQNKEDKTHGRSTSHVRSLSTITAELDQEIVKKVWTLGYPREFVVNWLRMNNLNYSTTSYYLLMQKKAHKALENA